MSEGNVSDHSELMFPRIVSRRNTKKSDLNGRIFEVVPTNSTFFKSCRETDVAIAPPLRRRKYGDTPVSPAPPCQTPLLGSSSTLLQNH